MRSLRERIPAQHSYRPLRPTGSLNRHLSLKRVRPRPLSPRQPRMQPRQPPPPLPRQGRLRGPKQVKAPTSKAARGAQALQRAEKLAKPVAKQSPKATGTKIESCGQRKMTVAATRTRRACKSQRMKRRRRKRSGASCVSSSSATRSRTWTIRKVPKRGPLPSQRAPKGPKLSVSSL